MNLMTLFIILLVLMLLGALPVWPHMANYNYGWYPSGGLGLVVLVLVILLLLGRI